MNAADGPERGQAHTLESVMAALLVVSAVIIAVQMTTTPPLLGSTANQHAGQQDRATVQGVFAASDDGELRDAVRYRNETGDPADPLERPYGGAGPTGDLRFLDRLNETLADRGAAYNVRFVYHEDGERRVVRFVHNGEPGDAAVTVRRPVTLYDHDRTLPTNGTGEALGAADPAYFVSDTDPDGEVYAVVTVEVVVWRV
ncbi:hypothetical protein J2752_000275 [Halarchaeum rubridurum]|uniref:Uncharacterized protein n=1 Tax=Halarchaeum rubridurum TaxID=489911 RepID=A0A830FMV0_9EURY|nr:hypothetical protein [Halarchaeum rubridurum]MBP1953394.1 hypothetical protein [Halarchaeum rubridurum]GGM65621.1 hypothetical protein GCM10009017_14640 [Halarchaeum rubridurum]